MHADAILHPFIFPQKLLTNKKIAVQQKTQDNLRKIKEIKHSLRFNKVSGIDLIKRILFLKKLYIAFKLVLSVEVLKDYCVSTCIDSVVMIFHLILQQAKEKETEENIKFFKDAFDRSNAELLELTEKSHKETERRGEKLIRELDEEIKDLKRRQTELEKLSCPMDFTQVSLSQQTMVRN